MASKVKEAYLKRDLAGKIPSLFTKRLNCVNRAGGITSFLAEAWQRYANFELNASACAEQIIIFSALSMSSALSSPVDFFIPCIELRNQRINFITYENLSYQFTLATEMHYISDVTDR